MDTLAEFRAKYPQYDDMSDQDLADALHRKFYSDVPKAAFESRIGLRPKGAERGMAETFARGAAQGLSYNLADELSGAHAAGPALAAALPGGAIARTLVGAGRLGLNALTGADPAAAEAYARGRDEFRTAEREGREQNPVSSAAGNVTGALVGAAMLPAAAAATAPLRVRAGLGALSGAAQGAASGAGEGETLGERVRGGVQGGVVGGLVGGVAPAVLDAIAAGARPIAERVGSAIRGYRDPAAEAARRAATMVDRAVESDPQAASRLTNREFSDAAGTAMNVDLMGEQGRALARSAANQSPEARSILQRELSDRYEGDSGRFTDWLRSTFHYPDADAQSAALVKASREVNKPNYAKAYAEGANLPFDEGLQYVVQSPYVQDAIRKAMVNAKNEAAKMGFPPPKNPFRFDESGRLQLAANADGSTMTPNLQFWDIVKRNLDRGPREAQDWSKILREHLDELVPSYQQARAGAAHFFDADNALKAGENFLNKNMTRSDARRALAAMSDSERKLFQDGFVSKYLEMLDNVKYRRSVLNQISDSPAATEKLKIALGPEKAAELEAKLRVEGIMDMARQAVSGNSKTVQYLTELGLAGTAGYGLTGGGVNPLESPGAVVSGLLSMGAARGAHKIEGNVARKLADLLVSKDPRDLQRGVDIIRKSPPLMGALRTADRYIARVAGEEASPTPERPRVTIDTTNLR